jgi:D-glycero-beta-D-manno-heptose 1-phosphate adenylyltransferase
MHSIADKILLRSQLTPQALRWKLKDDVIVFTNGCFDLLHAGHVDYLIKAKALGSRLVIGLNGDASPYWADKGPNRPLNNQTARAAILAALQCVDAVVVFDEETPENLIQELSPNILVKGADYLGKPIAGADFVKANGGRVELIPYLEGFSTTGLIEKIKKS